MGARGKWWASSASVLGARQMVSGGVEWQVAEANGVRHRQMVGAGGMQWEFKLKAVEANGGQRTRMAAEASGSCLMRVGRQIVGIGGCECWASGKWCGREWRQKQVVGARGDQKKENNQPEVAVMAAAGGGGSPWPMRKYPKKGQQSTGAGCDGGRRRWWRF